MITKISIDQSKKSFCVYIRKPYLCVYVCNYHLSKFDKILQKILNGLSDHNIDFPEFLNLLINLGFELRQKGSHHILTKDGMEEIVNIQPKNGKAKAYQVKQVREIIIKYSLNSNKDE